MRRKEENRVTHIGGGYFKNFGDEIPQATGTSSEINTETTKIQKHIPDTESTVSSTPEEPVITEEPGSYPAIPVQEYREGPIEEIAVHYVRINKVIETKAPRNRQQEDNIRAAELDFMLDLETLIKETAPDPDLIEVQCCIEDNKTQAIPDDYKQVAKKLTHRLGITMVDDRIIIPKSLRYAALNALHFGHPGINKMCNDAVIFWWPNMRADIDKAKTCSACLNAGKNLKTQLPSTEKSKLEPPKYPGEEIQIDFTGNFDSKHLDSSPFILVAVDKNSRWPVAKICKNTNHDTVIIFLREYINVYGVPKTIKSDNGSAFISKEHKSFCKEYNIIRKYGTPNLHTGTGLVEKTTQSLKNLTKTNLEETQNLRESLNKALYVLRSTTHSEIKKTPFELHFGREPGTKLSNLKNSISVNSKDLSVYITRNSAGEIIDLLVMSKKKTNDLKYRRGMTFTQKRKPSNTVSKEKNTNYPFTFFEKTHTKCSLGSKFKYEPLTAVSGTKHTVTTDKNKILHRKLISNPIPFQATTTPTKRINTRLTTTAEKPTCSKATENTCLYRRKEAPKPENTENSAEWLKRKEQPRNERGQFTSPDKSAGKPMDLDLSIVSDDEFQCYNTSEGKHVHANIDDELQLLPKETNLTPETGIKTNPLINEPQLTVRKSKRIPNARQTEKLGGIPYSTNNNKRKINNYMLQENQASQPSQQQTEERNNREIRTINREIRKTAEYQNFNRLIRNHQQLPPLETESTRRRGNVECRGHRLNYFRQRVV